MHRVYVSLCEMFICEMIGKENFRKALLWKKKENEFQRDSFVNDEHLILCFVFLNYCFVFFSILKRSDMYKILNLKKLHSDIYDSYFSKKKEEIYFFQCTSSNNLHLHWYWAPPRKTKSEIRPASRWLLSF